MTLNKAIEIINEFAKVVNDGSINCALALCDFHENHSTYTTRGLLRDIEEEIVSFAQYYDKNFQIKREDKQITETTYRLIEKTDEN